MQKLVHDPRQAEQDGLPEQLARHLGEASALVEEADAERRQSAAKSAQAMGIRRGKAGELGSKTLELPGLRQEAESQIQAVRARLQALGLSGKVKQWDGVAAAVGQRFDRLEEAFRSVRGSRTAGGHGQALARARAVLRQLQAPPGPASAPGSEPAPTFRIGTPALRRDGPVSDRLPQYRMSAVSAPKANPLASAGGFLLGLLLGGPLQAAPSAPPAEAAACGYAAADLAASDDAQITAEIQALAARLGYSPARIFDWVYNQVRFEPYFGSLKGSQGAYYTLAGNATDQASLLIALLRASKIPARYVQGNIQIVDPAASQGQNGRAPRWLGVKTYRAAANVLANGLNPNAATVTNGAADVGVGLRQVWVEACVPYGNYRGEALDNSGYRWIPLDPSFKDTRLQPGIPGVAANVAFDYSAATGYLKTRTDELPQEAYQRQAANYILGLDPDNSLRDVGYIGATTPRALDILPAALPYTVAGFVNWSNTATPETAALPDSHRYKLQVTVKDTAGTALLSQTIGYPKAALQRLTLSYAPDAATQPVWGAWSGDLAALPAALVKVSPVLKIGRGRAEHPARHRGPQPGGCPQPGHEAHAGRHDPGRPLRQRLGQGKRPERPRHALRQQDRV